MEEQSPNQITVVNLILPPIFSIVIGLVSQVVAWISSRIVLSKWQDDFGLFHDLTLLDVLKNILPQLVWLISFGVFSVSVLHSFKLRQENHLIARNLKILILISLLTMTFSPLNYDYYSGSLSLIFRELILLFYYLFLFALLLLSTFTYIRSKHHKQPLPEYVGKIFALTFMVFLSLGIVSYYP